MLLGGRVADELVLPMGWSELAGGISPRDRGSARHPRPYRGLDELGAPRFRSAGRRWSCSRRSSHSGRGGRSSPGVRAARADGAVRGAGGRADHGARVLAAAGLLAAMVLFLRLEKLRRSDAPAGGALALAVTVIAFVAARCSTATILVRLRDGTPRPRRPSRRRSRGATATTAELAARRARDAAQARAQRAAYWKAETSTSSTASAGCAAGRLDREASTSPATRGSAPLHAGDQGLVRNLRTDRFITAGPRVTSTSRGERPPAARRSVGRAAHAAPGDAYTSTVYTPQPTEHQRRRRRFYEDFDEYAHRVRRSSRPRAGQRRGAFGVVP